MVLFLPVAAPELSGGWGIDDIDNSFSTQPFLIRDARQDVFLSVLISFNLALGKNEAMISLFFFFFFVVWGGRRWWVCWGGLDEGLIRMRHKRTLEEYFDSQVAWAHISHQYPTCSLVMWNIAHRGALRRVFLFCCQPILLERSEGYLLLVQAISI